MKTPKKLIAYLLIIVILIASSLIDLTSMDNFWWVDQDKHFHLVVFALFMVVTKLLFKEFSLFKISLITFSLGLLIELLQAWFTQGTRQFDGYDIVFNLLGIAIGLFLLWVYQKNPIGNS